MNKTLKFGILLAIASASVAAHASDGFLSRLQVSNGRASGNLGDLRRSDAKLFRIAPLGGNFDWNCTSLSTINPLRVRIIEVKIFGSRTADRPISMYWFDFIARRWVSMGIVALPTVGLGSTRAFTGTAPERFVSAGGETKIRFRTDKRVTMIVDQIVVKVTR